MDGVARGMASNVLGVLDNDCDTVSLLEKAATSRPEVQHWEGSTTFGGRSPKPAWWLLYAVPLLTALLFLLADLVPASSAWRSVSEFLAALVAFGALGLWLHANRIALIFAEYSAHSETTPELPSGKPED